MNSEYNLMMARREVAFGENDTTDVLFDLCGTYDLQDAITMYHDMLIIDGLKRCGYNISDTSRFLNVTREVIKDVCKKYGIDNLKMRKKHKELLKKANERRI